MHGAPTAAWLGAALLVAGLGFGAPSLTVAGIGLTGLTLVAVTWVELARPRRLVRARGPTRVVEGDPVTIRISASGSLVRPPGGELTDPLLAEPVAIGPLWRGSHLTEVTLAGRGLRRLDAARIEVRDPLGLWSRVVESEVPHDLLVLPRIEQVHVGGAAGGGGVGSLAGLVDGATAGDPEAFAIELEIDGLRAYREGSPASRIHWPAVARTGELIERRLTAGADSVPLVVLDSSHPAGNDELDAAVRAAASLCAHLGQRGGCVALLPGNRRPIAIDSDLRSWPNLHARFALVEPGPPPSVPTASRSGAIFWVTARARPSLPGALRSAASAGRFLVSPTRPAATAPAAFVVGGCEGRRFGARRTRSLRRVA
jgi:uncharacterized protein (DUF58 family)